MPLSISELRSFDSERDKPKIVYEKTGYASTPDGSGKKNSGDRVVPFTTPAWKGASGARGSERLSADRIAGTTCEIPNIVKSKTAGPAQS
jgi:hypothetical protein